MQSGGRYSRIASGLRSGALRARTGKLRASFLLPAVSLHDLRLPRFDRTAAAHPRRTRLPDPDPGAEPGHPRRAQGPRPDGRGADRHRQDRRFRPAAAAAPDPGRSAGGQQHGACAGAGADPRAGRTGAAELPGLRPAPAAEQLRGVRRRQHQPADDEAAQGRRRAGGHAGAAARPVPAERGEVRPAADPGAGRGRPHARSGLRP